MSNTSNFIMKEYNGTDYDTLYPKNNTQQILLNDVNLANYLGLDSTNPTSNNVLYNIGYAKVVVMSASEDTITATNGTVTLTQTVGQYKAIFKILSYGTWTFTSSTYNTTKQIIIDELKTYKVSFLTLQNTSWPIISQISNNGDASFVFNIGDTKSVIIDGSTYNVQIIGFHHDIKTSGGYAGITFQLETVYGSGPYLSNYVMNNSDTNVGGWALSYMRTTTMPNMLSLLPNDLKNVIIPVNKRTSVGGKSNTISTTSDSLFLLSEIETFGSNVTSYPGEGSWYEYYSAGNSKLKNGINGQSNYGWWERSPSDVTGCFCIVGGDGAGDRPLISAASILFSLSFAFCV